MKVILTILLLFIHSSVRAKDATTLNFIKLFIQNDGKPTHLIYGGLCWKKSTLFLYFTKNVLLKEKNKPRIRSHVTFTSFRPY